VTWRWLTRLPPVGALDGIALGVKANIDVAGMPTSNGFAGSSPIT
jgi:Asp-tRNA(Asn)/Glu-tRNA(Gln) amidotransferase A subunit family amidase